ncbi:MAG: hypothetical protein CUN57_02720, partial [Phototrophicales bacterium]
MTDKKRILHITYGSVRHAPRLNHATKSAADHEYAVSIIGAPREPFPAQPSQEVMDGISSFLIPLLTRISFSDILKAVKQWVVADLGTETTPMPNNRIKLRTGLN